MDIVKQLLGRLHPLIVHLPIGFIIVGILLQIYDRRKKELNKVISLIYLWATYFAIAACITGYLQYVDEGYSFASVKLHLWSGIATALFSLGMWALLKGNSIVSFMSKAPVLLFPSLFFVLISFTGHQGGTITHGEEYLVEPLPNTVKSALGYEIFEEKNIVLTEESWESAVLYTDVVAPILNNNCVSCHNVEKTKGELLLSTPEGILESGENSPVVIAKHSDQSDLFTRMKLPGNDDDHMPPDGKRQPSKAEINVIGIWIENGLSFNKTIGELGMDKSHFKPFFPKTILNDYPDIEITKAPMDSIVKIESLGIHIDPISESTHFLSVSCINLPTFTDADIKHLLSIKNQIAVLDIGGTQITDAIFEKLIQLPNLTILKLDNTTITGNQIALLATLKYLRTINLSSTRFSVENLDKLASFKSLKKVFLHNTDFGKTGTETIRQGQITLEYGNYNLPLIATDSIVY